MNLIVDIGNTRIKTAFYSGNNLIKLNVCENNDDIFSNDLISQCSNIIIGSVVNEIDVIFSELSKMKPTLLFSSHTEIPIKNNYQSLSTLGSDRIAASVGAYYLYQNKNVLVIDAGTCIKYNFTNSANEYLGGGISPGIAMKFKALHQFTSKLPLIKKELTGTDLIGTNTESSILSGVLNGTCSEIDGIINSYKENYPDLICILTGGDSPYLTNHLKNSIFTHPNLVLKGLNDILNYNT